MVDRGVVTFTGRVTMPHKADAFVDLASRVKGVQRVNNLVQVDPPLHFIVEHGRVTLTGVVLSEVERRKAEMIALSTFGVFSVDNKLTLDDD